MYRFFDENGNPTDPEGFDFETGWYPGSDKPNPKNLLKHEFVGRSDRWCEICNLPDRNPIHKVKTAQQIIPEPISVLFNHLISEPGRNIQRGLSGSAQLYDPIVTVKSERLYMSLPVRIDSFCKLECGEGMYIGKYCHVASFCHLGIGGGLLILEDGSSCASGVKIITGSNQPGEGHGCSAIDPAAIIKRSFVHVKRNATLYTGVIVCPGVTIGEGAVVLPGAVVTKNIPKGETWGGIPAKKISKVGFILAVDEVRKQHLSYISQQECEQYAAERIESIRKVEPEHCQHPIFDTKDFATGKCLHCGLPGYMDSSGKVVYQSSTGRCDPSCGCRLESAVIVHPCCGCSCHVCADGHNTKKPFHTEECKRRFWAEASQEEVSSSSIDHTKEVIDRIESRKEVRFSARTANLSKGEQSLDMWTASQAEMYCWDVNGDDAKDKK